ncbi:hypothetical protein BKA62DRAFT_833483 [Auriculariales sp. MPI-PUGE-AT-0066]|nr:hypothetical protein BKA62DRAFT_833483 [Auriculariales sp. MPI-PUGE-AT-0066]
MNTHPSCLPSEVFISIFDALALKELVLLMAVYRRWRDLVLGHPTYHSTLDLPDGATPPELFFFFARAERSALSQRRLTMDIQFWNGAQPVIKRTIDALPLNRAHIVQLRLQFQSDMFTRVTGAIYSMAQIERLDLTALQPGGQGRLAKSVVWSSGAYFVMPKLRHIRLAGIRFEGLCPKLFPGVVSLALVFPWDGELVAFDCVKVMDALPALRDLVLSGHISLLNPHDTADRPSLDCLVAHTRCIDVQWPVLRHYLAQVRALEFNMINQEGADVIAEHLHGEMFERIAIRSSDDCIVFSLTGECGKSIIFAYGGDGYEILPDESAHRDIQWLSGHLFADRITRAEVEVDMWESQCCRKYAYPGLKIITIVWMEDAGVDDAACARADDYDVDSLNRLRMPIGRPGPFYRCPNLRTLRLENRVSSSVTAYIDALDVVDFARRSFTQIDLSNITLELVGIGLIRSAHNACSEVPSRNAVPERMSIYGWFIASLPQLHPYLPLGSNGDMNAHLNRLPSEVCISILDAFALRELVLLMAVCAHWRDLILSHPTYYSTLDLPNGATPAQMLFFFIRADRAALSQRRLTMDVQFWDAVQAAADRIVDVIVLNQTHLARLRVHCRAEMFTRVEQAIRTMSQIEHLDLTALLADGQGRLAQNTVWASGAHSAMPKLRYLRLAGIRLEDMCPKMFVGLVSFVLVLPWDGQPVAFDCEMVMGALTALRDLALTGHISLLYPRDNAAKTMLQRLVVHSRCIDVQWPVLRYYLADVRALEFNMLNQKGTDAMADHLEGELVERIAIRSSDDCIEFSLTDACGKSFTFAYGGDGYDTLPEDVATRDIYRLSNEDFVHRITRVEIDVDMWDTQPRRNHAYPTLEAITIFWIECPPVDNTAVSSDDEPHAASAFTLLIMPGGEPGPYHICPKLKTLRLESRIKAKICAYIDTRDVEEFARRNFDQLDISKITLDLARIRHLHCIQAPHDKGFVSDSLTFRAIRSLPTP